jgi:hypothetical protein
MIATSPTHEPRNPNWLAGWLSHIGSENERFRLVLASCSFPKNRWLQDLLLWGKKVLEATLIIWGKCVQHNIKKHKVKDKGLWVGMIRMPNQQIDTRSAIPPLMAASLVH